MLSLNQKKKKENKNLAHMVEGGKCVKSEVKVDSADVGTLKLAVMAQCGGKDS